VDGDGACAVAAREEAGEVVTKRLPVCGRCKLAHDPDFPAEWPDSAASPIFQSDVVADAWGALERGWLHMLRTGGGQSPAAAYWLWAARVVDGGWGAPTGWVYLISPHVNNAAPGPEDRFVKVGYSSDPGRRLSELQTGCPYPLAVAATYPGCRRLERAIHLAIGDHRSHGEWYERSVRTAALFYVLETVAVAAQIRCARGEDVS
jgi:hypothetical protein